MGRLIADKSAACEQEHKLSVSADSVLADSTLADPTPRLPVLHLDNQLCFSLYSLSRLITQSYTPLLKPVGLTYPQYLVMLVLWQSWEEGAKNITIGYLSQRLKLDTGTVTPLLKRMEAKALLTRTRSEKDERMVLVALTEQGCQLRARAKHIPAELLCRSDASMEKVIDLRVRLKEMLDSLS